MMRPRRRRYVVQVVVVYAAAAAAWVTLSDWLLSLVVTDPEVLTRVAVAKGIGFVLITAGLLYGLLGRLMKRLGREAEAQARAQAELKQWADAFTHCAHGIAIVATREGRVFACNPAFAGLLGRRVAETVGMRMIELCEPAERSLVLQLIGEADDNGRVQFETRLVGAEGRSRQVQVDLVSVRSLSGELLHRVATVQDIAGHKAAVETMKLSENRLRTVIENLTEGLLITDQAGAPVLWNRELLRMLDLADTEETRRRLPDFWSTLEIATVDGRVLPAADRPVQRLLRDGPFRDLRLELRRFGQGEARIYSFGGTLVQDAAGRSLGIFTINDVTERSRAVKALRESEQRFRAVVESIQEVFWIRDPVRNQIIYVSPAFRVIWGRDPGSVTGGGVERWLDTIHPDDRLVVERALKQLPMPELEYRILRPDGSTRWVRDQAFLASDAAGQPERIVGVAQDITERKQLEAQFLRAQRMEAIGTLAGGIAHDLNNILAPMLMAAGLLKERVTDIHDRDMLDMVERSARRGAEIIRQLLTFSRGAEGSRIALQPRHLVKEVGTIIRETFPREISYTEDAPTELWPVVADATQLQQVLVNLTVNARDAMAGGGQLVISAGNREITEADLHVTPGIVPGRYVLITVADTGTGMPPEIIDRIFDPFFTTKAPGKGTGLGLSTVLGIVRGHGGFIAVRSELGHGSTFDVYLPATPAGVLEEPHTASEPLPTGHGEIILVVDDEDSVRTATCRVLEQHHYRVLAATNGKEALTLFVPQREQIELVLTDMMMPEMGGIPLVRALLLIKPEVKIIATSGLAEVPPREELLGLGIKEVLPKPSGPKALLDLVRRVLDEGAVVQESAGYRADAER